MAHPKITLSKMESISGIPGDDGEQLVYVEGVVLTAGPNAGQPMAVAAIGRIMCQTYYNEYRVGCYDVEVDGDADVPFYTQNLDIMGGAQTRHNARMLAAREGYATTRAAHTAAKSYARGRVLDHCRIALAIGAFIAGVSK